MKRFIYPLLIIQIVWFSGCDLEDVNIDPNRVLTEDVEQPHLILPAALAQTARNIGSQGARVTGSVIQHFKGTALQALDYTVYNIDAGNLNTFFRTGLYAGAMKDCSEIIRISERPADTLHHYIGVAKILLAYNMNIATTFWGDVPFDEALQGEDNFKPTYNTQEEVYNGIQQLLDEAMVHLAKDPGSLALDTSDLIHQGNNAAWIATARALKARYYMHLVKRDPDASQKAINSLLFGSISSNEYQPDFPYLLAPNSANPIGLTWQTVTGSRLYLGDSFVSMLQSLSDPRLSIYGSGSDYAIYSNGDEGSGPFWGRYDTPLPLISYSELCFIKAEAFLRLGDESNAQAQLQKAIQANFDYLGVTDDTYVTVNGNLGALASFDEQLQRIMEQKYIAMYGQGTLESWVDYRRTGYPVLTPPSDLIYSFNPSGVIPQRYLYPDSEISTNGTNVNAAIERQGGQLMDVTLWAFQ